jgi:hypothetical protein
MVPYNNIASDYLQTKYFPGEPVKANLAMSIPDTLAMLLIPLMGHFVDRMGKKVQLIRLGALMFMVGHFLLGHGPDRSIFCAIISLLLLGIAYSTLLSFWACVPKVVRFVRHSTAYGVLTSSCNLSVTVISLAVAPLVAHDPTYRTVGAFYSLLALVAFILGTLVGSLDFHRRLGLNQLHQRPQPPHQPMFVATAAGRREGKYYGYEAIPSSKQY